MALLTLGVLILFHELGHFIAGRKLGVYIHEFSIGFGPKLLSRDSEETEFTFRMIPLGGFVRLQVKMSGKMGKSPIFPERGCCIRLLPARDP